MNKIYFLAALICAGLPLSVSASTGPVRINEVAWMGTTVSGTNEWVELYNASASPIDLSGWRIEAADGSPSIALRGTIDAFGYFLIERTDDTTVPDVAADLVISFGKGLSNGGETLQLRDASGGVIDAIVGGANWAKIGGNNTTKETAQRDESGWFTSRATPRAANVRPIRKVPLPAAPAQATPVIAPDTPPSRQKAPPSSKPKSATSISKSESLAASSAPINASSGAATVLWERGSSAASTGGFSHYATWAFVLLGGLLLALAGFIITRNKVDEANIADEYAILEEVIEKEQNS